jgi:hypothetical protein
MKAKGLDRKISAINDLEVLFEAFSRFGRKSRAKKITGGSENPEARPSL